MCRKNRGIKERDGYQNRATGHSGVPNKKASILQIENRTWTTQGKNTITVSINNPSFKRETRV